MNILQETLHTLGKALGGDMSGTQLESVQSTIRHYAIAAAVASVVSAAVPGVAGLVAMATQTGLILATFIKINKTLGISMKEKTAKTICSAIISYLVADAGAAIVAYGAAVVIAFIPIFGQALAAAANAAIGYILIYTCAVIYLKVVTDMIQPNGTIDIPEAEDSKLIIKRIMEKNNIKAIIEEGRDNYKKAKNSGEITEAIKNRRCPACGAPVKDNQKFCSECGSALC